MGKILRTGEHGSSGPRLSFVVCSMVMAPKLIGHVHHVDLKPAYGGNHVPSSTTTLMLGIFRIRADRTMWIERKRLSSRRCTLTAGHACTRLSRRLDSPSRANDQLIANTQDVGRFLGPASSSFPTVAAALCLSRSDAQAFSYKHFLVKVSHKILGKNPTGWLITQNRAG